jgi:precorrin-2/cobalt-factor-2 C20-methyltransferase
VSGVLTGVGVGPGDPDLLTCKGRDVLLEADVLFVPVAATDELGYAERVVTAHVPHATPITRLVFSVTAGTAERDASWARAAARVADVVAHGRHAAFATIGDPNVYSTFSHLARQVRDLVPSVTVRTVPGITAMQDLAARSGTVLLERDERLALLPFTAGPDHVRRALTDADTVVLYKGGRRLPEVRALIEESGRADHAVFGARLGLEHEDVRAGLPDGAAPYLSTVVVTRQRP